MTGDSWIALAAFVFSLICASAWISGRLSKVEGKLENGINSSLQQLEKSVDKLGERFDRAPCSEHAVQMADIARRLETLEE